jgi:predicted metal-dependent peptidase
MSRKSDEQRRNRRRDARNKGLTMALGNTVLMGFRNGVGISRHATVAVDQNGWAAVDDSGVITVNPDRDGDAEEWAWVFAHLVLHLGLDHTSPDRLNGFAAVRGDSIDPVYGAVCCLSVNRMSEIVRIGRPPFFMPDLPGGDDEELVSRWRREGIPETLQRCGTNGAAPCLILKSRYLRYGARTSWSDRFARGLAKAATDAMSDAADARGQGITQRPQGPWDQAMSWFLSSFPLLAAVAAGFILVPDKEIARAWDISIAAVSPEHGEVYINPTASLSAGEWRFVLAHEMLHAALRHDRRAGGRDVHLWNVACDYVINGWLTTMGVGTIPEGTLYDPALTGLSAESVYDTLTTDMRRARRLSTLGRPTGDMLGDWLTEPAAAQRRSSRRHHKPMPWDCVDRARTVDLDEFYRRALTQGLEHHHASHRGLVAAGLEEEIRALDQPPLPWDAKLARWFDEHVRAPEPQRTYARASRRQAATPDIPRPGRVRPEQRASRPTFGVVLDTSGSMDNQLLGKALGAIASYATARDVPAARVVFCDAVAYDAGYLPVEEIATRVRVRGRGGTVLQPGVTLLERADDFPADGPILVITDGDCDVLRLRREHAFLTPRSARLPFTPRGPVFHVE